LVKKSLLSGAEEAEGISIVIDVFRAFTCSALMFHYGVKKCILVKEPEEALALKVGDNMIISGEVKGRKHPGFDVGNSPTKIVEMGKSFFLGKTVIQRTSSGTRGAVIACNKSDKVILGSFVTAKAIAEHILAFKNQETTVSIIAMGSEGDKPSVGDEFCSDYIEHLLTGSNYDHVFAMSSILREDSIQKNLQGGRSYFPKEDIIWCLQRDIFSFVLAAHKENEQIVVSRIDCKGLQGEFSNKLPLSFEHINKL